jgi:riboflavin biosynthesis pyrimidine reductase
MPVILRASVSLDGKLLSSPGHPGGRAIPESSLRAADELILTLHPLIIGGDGAMLAESADGFLPEDISWELLSVTKGARGRITTRYRRKELRVRRASRRSPGEK